MKAMPSSPTLVPPSQQRLHKSQFLHKVSCQKFCWDQARLSSLINKQVADQPNQFSNLVQSSSKSTSSVFHPLSASISLHRPPSLPGGARMWTSSSHGGANIWTSSPPGGAVSKTSSPQEERNGGLLHLQEERLVGPLHPQVERKVGSLTSRRSA